ncbi:MAG: hypothetical protein ACK56I_01795, partial [bacterium]
MGVAIRMVLGLGDIEVSHSQPANAALVFNNVWLRSPSEVVRGSGRGATPSHDTWVGRLRSGLSVGAHGADTEVCVP